MRLKKKVAVITGSARGIGEAIARIFATEGAHVVISDLNEVGGLAVASDISKNGGTAFFQPADIRIEAQCRKLIDVAVEQFGRLDILVNNAAITTRGNIETTSVDEWDDLFATNVRGAFVCTQQAVGYMKTQLQGTIVNIGSVNAYIGESKLMAYSASKGALMTLTKNIAGYLNRYRIRVNQINVGWTLTPGERVAKLSEGRDENWLASAGTMRPFGRLLLPEDVARAVLFFASDNTECITGTVLDFEQYPIGAPNDL